ncbi:MAG: sigma-70 family RNA polymerase sigma factor [Cytophagales bacterium]|nr:sigma-70 family RNA polymerase sigma factor [Cytophagales bacterium]
MTTVKSIPIATLRDYTQIDLALTGNQQAYRALFKRYWKRLFFTVNKLIPDKEEARDITMEAFSKAFDNLHRFQKDYNFNTWLYRVAINHSLDHLRRKRLPTTPLSTFQVEDAYDFFVWGNDQDWGNKNPEEQIIQWQKSIAIQEQLQALPPQLRDIARMRFADAYSYAEIATALGLPLGTVKAGIHRARRLLREALEPWRQYA